MDLAFVRTSALSENLSKIYRTSIENLSKIYRKSMGGSAHEGQIDPRSTPDTPRSTLEVRTKARIPPRYFLDPPQIHPRYPPDPPQIHENLSKIYGEIDRKSMETKIYRKSTEIHRRLSTLQNWPDAQPPPTPTTRRPRPNSRNLPLI